MTRALIITGMHRSGTSLVASLFDKAGVSLGAQMLAPQADSNPLGFFEDVDFLEFHQAALYARGENILVTRAFTFNPTDAETARARALIAPRVKLEMWGWKDPRTSLFLDFWNTLVPGARYLFVYRHPYDVLLSLARRGEVVGFDFYAGLEAWYAYNHALFEFARRHPERALVCSSYALLEHIQSFGKLLAQKLEIRLTLTNTLRDEIFHAEQLRRLERTDAAQNILQQIHPDAMQLHESMQQFAALPDTTPIVPAPPAQNAFAQFVAQLPQPLHHGTRRALLHTLVTLTDPALYEKFAREHVARTNELETQRRAWEHTAQEREQVIRAETAWAAPRLKYLETLETNRLVRALTRLGIVPRDTQA